MDAVELRRGADRGLTATDWLSSRHSFSFGGFYEPGNVCFGQLLVHNEDVIQPGPGYTTHAHRDTEILTWVLDGALAHSDSLGNHGVIEPGVVQRTSAGTGVEHSERAAGDRPVHLVQMWLSPQPRGTEPGYDRLDVGERLATGGLVPVASGLGHAGALTLHRPDAALHLARLPAGASVALPDAPYRHLFCARGTVELAGARLSAGDAARSTGTGPSRVAATSDAEILLWEMHTSLTG